MSSTSWQARGLYAVTDAQLLPDDSLYRSVEAAVRGGAVLVQYRDKQASPPQKKERAERLLHLCNALSCPLLINDDVELAVAIGAPGVHLGRTDGSLAAARQRLGAQAIIGATCHGSLEFAREAKEQGASYVAFGSFFPSATKPNASPASLNILARAHNELELPIVAIGGITLENAPPLITAGADLLAVISGLFTAPDIKRRAVEFTQLFS